jgi:hypothetical protein
LVGNSPNPFSHVLGDVEEIVAAGESHPQATEESTAPCVEDRCDLIFTLRHRKYEGQHGHGADLRRLALALEGTTEAPHFSRTAFKVARTYVTLSADGRSANFKFTPDEQEFKCLMAPEAFAPAPKGWGRMGWTTATLSKLSTAELKAALEKAHAHAAKKPGKRKARR